MKLHVAGAPVMGRALFGLRAICPGPLAFARLIVVYAILVLAAQRGRPRTRRVRIQVGGQTRDWWVADAGEIAALWEVFVANEYSEFLPERAEVVFDAGANVGTASAWLRTRYPDADIVAIEPDPDTAQRLRRNVGGDPKVTVVQGAVADVDGTLTFAPGEWTMRGELVEGGGEGLQVDALTLATLRERHAGGRPVDLLKLDTEGGEWLVLTTALDGIDAVVMEIHPPAPDGADADAWLGDVAEREGMELRKGSWPTIRWLLR